MRNFLIGAASIAMLATGAMAEPDKGKGGADHRGGGHAQASAKAEIRGPARVEARGKAETRLALRSDDNRGKGKAENDRGERKDERGESRGFEGKREDAKRIEGRAVVRAERSDDRREGDRYDDDRSRVRDVRFADRDDFARDREFLRRDYGRQIIDGCPPGLAKKNNGCLPPGLAKRDDRRYFRYDWQPRLFGLSNYDSGRYLYRDGYLMRIGGNNYVSGYIPLLGGALAIGNPWPSNYASYAVPNYYVDYYDLGPANSYRFADNVIYRVDPEDAAIMSVAAMLTGDDFTIGQPMPLGYDVYNVPYAYRDRYYDTPEAMYRYSDGYVYRIDPKTQLIAAAIDLLV